MIALWIALTVAAEIVVARAVGCLFAARDDFAAWERECAR